MIVDLLKSLPSFVQHLHFLQLNEVQDTHVCVYAVWGIGGLKNGAQRNVKPDLLRTVPRDRTTL